MPGADVGLCIICTIYGLPGHFPGGKSGVQTLSGTV